MPPKQDKTPPGPPFAKDERVLCFHMEMLYEAKILDVSASEATGEWQFKIHYKGWKSSWDDWVPQDRIRKYNDENKELASQLHAQQKMLQAGKVAKGPKKIGRGANGSDLSSARGSEERTAQSATQSGRGRRPRDFEIENVSFCFPCLFCFCSGATCIFFFPLPFWWLSVVYASHMCVMISHPWSLSSGLQNCALAFLSGNIQQQTRRCLREYCGNNAKREKQPQLHLSRFGQKCQIVLWVSALY